MSLYALNLFDLAENDDYLQYSRRSLDAVRKYGGSVTALGKLAPDAPVAVGDTPPRQALVLVEWPSREAFEGFLSDPEHQDLHPRARTARATTCGGPTTGSTISGRC